MDFTNLHGPIVRFKDGKAKALTFSYDDGVKQDIRLIDIFNKNGLKATFNISSGLFADEEGSRGNRMTKEQALKTYLNSGHEIAAHARTHIFLERVPSEYAVWEIISDKRNLEEMFQTIVRGFAYPFGEYNDDVLEILRLCNFAYARGVDSSESFELPIKPLELRPTCHHNCPALFDLADRFLNTNPRHNAYLFYVWGHSYEFDDDNNWDRIEEFAKKVGGNDDVWYATNIEIFEYLEAYYSLRFSADQSFVVNPTIKDIWFNYADEDFLVKSGETLKIK